MDLQDRNKVESIIDQILTEIGFKGHKLFEGLTISDITLLASESFLGEYLLWATDLKADLDKLKSFYFVFIGFRPLDPKTIFFKRMIESVEFNESEVRRYFKLGILILAFNLKEIKRFTENNFRLRGLSSDFFLHYLSNLNYEQLSVSDIERMQPLKKGYPSGAIIELGTLKWSKWNYEETRNGNGENLNYVTDQNSWEYANRAGIPACCSYAFLREFDEVLGLYYNWHAVKEIALSPPKGWRVPSKQDFEALIEYSNEDLASLSYTGDAQCETLLNSDRYLIFGGQIKETGLFLHGFGHDLMIWSSSAAEPNENSSHCLSLGPVNEHVVEIRTEVKGCGLRLRLIQETGTMAKPDPVRIPLSTDEGGQPAGKVEVSNYSFNATDFSWGDAVFSNPSTVGIVLCWIGGMLCHFVLNKFGSSGWWGLAVAPLVILSLGLIFSGAGYIINRFLKNIEKNDIWGIMSVTLAPVVFSIYAIPVVAVAVLFDWSWMLGIISTIGEWSTTTWKLALYTNIVAWLVFGQYAGKHFRRFIKESHLILAIIVGCITLVISILGIVTK